MGRLSSGLLSAGLFISIIGFVLISADLLTHPDHRAYLGGGDAEYTADSIGFIVVVIGNALQFIGQALDFVGRRRAPKRP
jgi:uncharacterized membrane protein